MLETFYGQLTLNPAETDKIRRHGKTLLGIFNQNKYPEVEQIDFDGDMWVEWSAEDPTMVDEQARAFRTDVALILALPEPIVCEHCGPSADVVLDIDIILTKIFHQEKDGSWKFSRDYEHTENPNYEVRCSNCGLSFCHEPGMDNLDIQGILKGSK